jgi:hypothetical protein
MPRTMKQGDSYPELHMRLSDANGPINLDPAPASISVYAKKGATAIGPLTATPDAPQSDPDVKGWITAPLSTSDTGVEGEYDVVAKVTWSAGQVTTFPSEGTEKITIEVNPHP